MSWGIQKYGHCPSCGRCWGCVKPHVLMLSGSAGVGVVCEPCWKNLDDTGKIVYHFRHFLRHSTEEHYSGKAWLNVQNAIFADAEREFEGYCQTCGETRRVPADKRSCPVCERTLQERAARRG